MSIKNHLLLVGVLSSVLSMQSTAGAAIAPLDEAHPGRGVSTLVRGAVAALAFWPGADAKPRTAPYTAKALGCEPGQVAAGCLAYGHTDLTQAQACGVLYPYSKPEHADNPYFNKYPYGLNPPSWDFEAIVLLRMFDRPDSSELRQERAEVRIQDNQTTMVKIGYAQLALGVASTDPTTQIFAMAATVLGGDIDPDLARFASAKLVKACSDGTDGGLASFVDLRRLETDNPLVRAVTAFYDGTNVEQNYLT